jgi:hypothetical protein
MPDHIRAPQPIIVTAMADNHSVITSVYQRHHHFSRKASVKLAALRPLPAAHRKTTIGRSR